MPYFIIYLIMLFLSGFIILNVCLKKKELSNTIIFSMPLGMLINTFIYLLLDKIGIKYNRIVLFVLLFCYMIILILFIYKKKVRIANDIKNIPWYFAIFIVFLLVKLVLSAYTSHFDWSNWDEFSAWQTGPKMAFVDGYEAVEGKFRSVPFLITNGAAVYGISGVTLNYLRIFSPVFLIMFALFMYFEQIKMNVNKDISALTTMVFLTSAPEILILARTYYNNIICMFFVCAGIWILTKSLIIKYDKYDFILSTILLIAAQFIRQEILYLNIALYIILFVILIFRKNENKRKIIYSFITIIAVTALWNLILKTYTTQVIPKIVQNDLLDKFKFTNIKTFLVNLKTQLIGFDQYHTYTISFVFAIVICIIIYILIKKLIKKGEIKNPDKEFDLFIIIALVQLVYIAIIMATQLFLFKMHEYLVAASFSRYMLLIFPLNFMVLGIIISRRYFKKEKNT